MTDTKRPSADALAFADWVLEFLVGYKTWAIEENRLALAQRIDAFADRRAAEARWAAIEECAQEMIARFGQGSMGIQLRNALRALADKPGAGKGEL